MIVLITPVLMVCASSAGAKDVRVEPAVTRGVEDPEVIIRLIFDKLTYDRDYFRRVLRHHASGSLPTSTDEKSFAVEVRRAQALEPVLERIFDARPSYDAGDYLPQPKRRSRTRVYDNLVGLLNMLRARTKGDPQRALSYGERIDVRNAGDLGVRLRAEPAYRLRVLREYYGLMGWAAFRMGQDEEARRWFDRIVQDKRLKELRDRSGEEGLSIEEKRTRRADRLRLTTLAVMPLENHGAQDDEDWWEEGLMEVLISDLSKYSDLELVERSQVDKLLYEYKFRYFRDERQDESLEGLLGFLDAASVLVGTYVPQEDGMRIHLRLVDASDGLIIGSEDGVAAPGDEFAVVRDLALKILERVGWVESLMVEDIVSSRVPRAEAIRDLVNARALMTTQQAEARRLYERALQTDPTYADSFEQLKKEFPDVKVRIAVAPFGNPSGAKDNEWILGAINRALHADLPAGGLDLVPRDTVASNLQVDEVPSDDRVPELGGLLDATFMVLGSVARSTERIRIDARLVSVQSAEVLFSDHVDGPDDDVSKVIGSLSETVLRAASQHLSEDVVKSLTGRRLSDEELRDLGELDAAERRKLAKPATVVEEQPPPPAPEEPDAFEERGRRLATGIGAWGGKPTLQLRARFFGGMFHPLTSELVVAVRDFQEGRTYQDLRVHYRLVIGARIFESWYLDGGVGVGVQIPSPSDQEMESSTAPTVPVHLETGFTGDWWHVGVEGGVDYVFGDGFQLIASLVLGIHF